MFYSKFRFRILFVPAKALILEYFLALLYVFDGNCSVSYFGGRSPEKESQGCLNKSPGSGRSKMLVEAD